MLGWADWGERWEGGAWETAGEGERSVRGKGNVIEGEREDYSKVSFTAATAQKGTKRSSNQQNCNFRRSSPVECVGASPLAASCNLTIFPLLFPKSELIPRFSDWTRFLPGSLQ